MPTFEVKDSLDEAKKLAELFLKNKKDTLTVSSRSVMDAFFAINGMDVKSEEIRTAISDYGDVGEKTVKQRLIDDVHMLPCKAETLLDFLSNKGSAMDTVFALEQYRGISPDYDKAVESFKSLVFMLLVYGVPADFLSADLCFQGDVQYSGNVFRIGDVAGGFVG